MREGGKSRPSTLEGRGRGYIEQSFAEKNNATWIFLTPNSFLVFWNDRYRTYQSRKPASGPSSQAVRNTLPTHSPSPLKYAVAPSQAAAGRSLLAECRRHLSTFSILVRP